MKTLMKQSVEEVERLLEELEELEDPAERIAARAKLFNDLLARFPDLKGALEIDGELLEPVSKKDVEDAQEQDHYDREDDRDASDMVSSDNDGNMDGCYGGDKGDDGGDSPRIRGMMAGPKEKGWGQTFKGVTDDVTGSGLLAHDIEAGTLRTGTDSVDLGGIWEEYIADEMGGGHRQRSLHTRYGGGIADGRAIAKKTFRRTCLLCKEGYNGTENAQYCDECKSPKYAHMRQQCRAEQGIPERTVKKRSSVTTNCLRCGEPRGRGKFCSPNCRKRYSEENRIVS
jgi:hypothetical protein